MVRSDTALARRALELVKDRGLTQEEQRKAGLPPQTLADWKRLIDDGAEVHMRPAKRTAAKRLIGERSGELGNDVPDPDIERVYEMFSTPEDRLLAIESVAAHNRSKALRHEARAAEREGEAAKIRARATFLAERRALIMCRRTKPPTADGGHRRDVPDSLPPPEEGDA